MTKSIRDITSENDALIVLMQLQLEQAYNTIKFLHQCLTSDKAVYMYPEHTIKELKEIKRLIPEHILTYCIHSNIREDCHSCKISQEKRIKRAEAKEVLKYEQAKRAS